MVFKPSPPKLCETCNSEIPLFILVNGNKRYRHGRKHCFDCRPFGIYYGPPLDASTHRICIKCYKKLPLSEFHLTNTQRGYKNSYCKPCQTVRVRNSRQRFKDECLEYKGRKCERCGYSRCRDALDFHHLGDKEFQLSRYQRCVLDEVVKAELDKCRLLCANCHREAHAAPNSFYEEVL